ncbi:MAG: patatin-like phospholipase family protein, partial [Flavobacteriales bacterium]
MTRTAPIPSYDTLLLEGGSLRCAFTAGVLDAFAAVGYRDFPRIYAVSAGAMAATSFLSGQRKHFIEVATSVIADGQFIRFSSALSEEGIMNLAHLFDHVRRHHPLDFEGAAEAARLREVRFVTTDAETGRPLYLDPVKGNWLRILW